MTTISKPPMWDGRGILPPIKPGLPGSSLERSPYQADIASFVEQFSFSSERAKLLDGLLRFRESLRNAGISAGFQWIDGSFLENIEALENRAPRDIDVVTFFFLPAGETQESLVLKAPDLFNHDLVKAAYCIDSYTFVLGNPLDSNQTNTIVYWYSMWSHRRNGLWKGFIQLDLNPLYDSDAAMLLRDNEGARHE